MHGQELEKESVNWTDLIERTFDFAMYAGMPSKMGISRRNSSSDPSRSNWVLKDGKLQANLHDSFSFQNIEKLDSFTFAEVRTDRKRHQLREK